MRFDVWRNLITRQWYFRIVADNGRILAWGEGYHNHNDCLATVDKIRGGRPIPVRELGTLLRAPRATR